MSFHVRAAHPSHFGWLKQRVNVALASDARAIECIDEKTGRVLGMVAYECWTPNSVQAHVAVDTPSAWRALIRPTFSYPFEEVGVGVLLATIPSANLKSIALVKHLGLSEAHRIRDGWADGIDLVVFEMRKENCRHLVGNRKQAA